MSAIFSKDVIHVCMFDNINEATKLATDDYASFFATNDKSEIKSIIRLIPPDTKNMIYACSYIFTKSDIEHFENPLINLHTGKIPENRGRNPLFWDIIEKKKKSYGTFHIIDEQIDQGKILEEVSVDVQEDDNPRDLANKILEYAINKDIFNRLMMEDSSKILKRGRAVGVGSYKRAFSSDTKYQSLNLTVDQLYRLWRCYSIWGEIQINDTPYSGISMTQEGRYEKIECLDGNIYGRKQGQ